MSNENKKSLLNKFVFQLKSKFDGVEIRAKLLENPCLKAAYLIRDVELNANLSNERSKLRCSLNSHCLSFQCDDEPQVTVAADERKAQFRANKTGARSLDEKLPPMSESSSSPFLTMKPLEERTNFFLPSIDLKGTHFSKQVIFFWVKKVSTRKSNIIIIFYKPKKATIKRDPSRNKCILAAIETFAERIQPGRYSSQREHFSALQGTKRRSHSSTRFCNESVHQGDQLYSSGCVWSRKYCNRWQ